MEKAMAKKQERGQSQCLILEGTYIHLQRDRSVSITLVIVQNNMRPCVQEKALSIASEFVFTQVGSHDEISVRFSTHFAH